MPNPTSIKPLVGITTDIRTIESIERRVGSATYADAITRAGGIPVFLDTNTDLIPDYLSVCHAFVLTGGDDPVMEPFGITTHPQARKVHEHRQRFELALLHALDHTQHPTLGVCLGMQYMAIHAGATLDQHLPETTPTHADHWDNDHPISGDYTGNVHSKHRQAITSPGSLTIAAAAHDSIIEAVKRTDHPFYVGVQWHPERTTSPETGSDIFKALVCACKA